MAQIDISTAVVNVAAGSYRVEVKFWDVATNTLLAQSQADVQVTGAPALPLAVNTPTVVVV